MTKRSDTAYVESKELACDGGNGPSGHPRVYLNMGGNTQIQCPYCCKQYILEEKAAARASGGH